MKEKGKDRSKIEERIWSDRQYYIDIAIPSGPGQRWALRHDSDSDDLRRWILHHWISQPTVPFHVWQHPCNAKFGGAGNFNQCVALIRTSPARNSLSRLRSLHTPKEATCSRMSSMSRLNRMPLKVDFWSIWWQWKNVSFEVLSICFDAKCVETSINSGRLGWIVINSFICPSDGLVLSVFCPSSTIAIPPKHVNGISHGKGSQLSRVTVRPVRTRLQ
jgi:hypothetical protein